MNLKKYLKVFITLGFVYFSFTNVYAQSPKKIVFASNNSSTEMLQIFVMDEDGMNKKQLTDLNENCYFPKFSPDGKSVVFNTDQARVYYIADIDEIDSMPAKYIFDGTTPAFSPDGSFIIFNSEYEGYLSIYALSLEETEPFRLSSGSYSNQQVWTSDGTKLVYSGFDESGTKCIYMENLEDTTDNSLKKISKNSNSNLEPDVSADGSMFIYASFDQNLSGTIIMNVKGKETSLTKGDSWKSPVFSPDDSKIACVKIVDDEKVKLYVMGLDGSGKKELAIKGGNIETFTWVDDDNILYDAETGTASTIGIIDIGTGKVRVLTNDGININPDIQREYVAEEEN
jgi:Tol biopolymer transport system component